MIQQSDIAGRLRLLRYGLIVLAVTTFLVALLVPFAYVRQLGDFAPAITEFLGTAVIATVIVGVLGAAVYFGYSMLLKRNAGS
jgi:hypothetical protein